MLYKLSHFYCKIRSLDNLTSYVVNCDLGRSLRIMELWHEMLCSFASRYTSVWEVLYTPSCVASHCNFHRCENLGS